jgi:hypothetical protein
MAWAPKEMIGADHALVAEAEAAGEIEAGKKRAEVGLSLAGRDGEALAIVGAEVGEDLVGGVEIAGLGEAEGFLYYEKGDISNVVSKGTFLMSVDSEPAAT